MSTRNKTHRMVATTTQPMGVLMLVCKIVDEIRKDIKAGRVPAKVKSYSELHEYVDANMYAYSFSIQLMGTDDTNKLVEWMNPATGIVNAYIVAGGLTAPDNEGPSVEQRVLRSMAVDMAAKRAKR